MPDPRSGSGTIRRDGTRRGAGASRLEAFHLLRAAQAELRARLRRPTLRPGGRYRDLVVFTRLLELERVHLAGGTAYSSDGTGSAELTAESDPEWSQSWGIAASLELHNVLRRHSARRERLGRLLTPAARARAIAAADQLYDAIALSVPWRAPEGSPLAPCGGAAAPVTANSATGRAGSSRLEAFFSLRAAQAELKARLRRPTLRPGGRYRDLVVFTRLLELERVHLAGGTAYSSDGTGSAELTAESDPEWSQSWGIAASLELHNVLRRHSARRERLGRLLTPAARARAIAAADQLYDAIALSVPWRAPEGSPLAPCGGAAAPVTANSATGRAGSSRLEAFFSLRAAQADLKARLRRPTLRPGSRYRDLVVFTRLLELERVHLAGRTTSSSSGSEEILEGTGTAELTGESDPEWSQSWGTAASLELHKVLQRHSARRERLGRLLTPAARARATEAADERYDAIALSVPWRVPDGTRPALPKSADPSVPAKRVTRPATAEGFPRVRRGTRPPYGLAAAGAVAAIALVVTLVASDQQGPEPGPGLQADAGAALRAAAAPSFERLDPVPVESPSATEGRKVRDRQSARRDPDGGANPPEPEAQPEPPPTDTAVPTSAPAPAPAPASTPAAPAPAPAPAPPPEPSQPATEDPPEFGFEH